MIVDTEAVVLHAMDLRDTSRIVTLYTRKYGKVKVVAKGVKNQKTNKFGSSLEPMTLSSVVFYKNEHRDLHLLSKSEIRHPLPHLQSDPERMFTGLALTELMQMTMHDEEENEPLFVLLSEAMTAVDAAPKNAVNVLFAFMVHLFDRFGFGLSLDACAQCGRTTEKEEFGSVHLRLTDGKFICPHCSEDQGVSGTKVSGGALRTLLHFRANGMDRAAQLSVSPSVKEEVTGLVQAYLRYHVEGSRPLRSLSLLHNITS